MTKRAYEHVYTAPPLIDLITFSFLLSLTAFPEMIRNVAVVGHLHHGKTALMDMLVFETHKMTWDADKPVSQHVPTQCVGSSC